MAQSTAGGLALTYLGELSQLGLPPLGQSWQPKALSLMPSAKMLQEERAINFDGLPKDSFAYNWGILADDTPDFYLAAVRVETMSQAGDRLANRIAMTTLDARLQPVAPLSFVDIPRPCGGSSTAEDPRLIRHQGQVYVAYNASMTREWHGPRAMHLAKLVTTGPPRRRHYALVDDKILIYNHFDDRPHPRLQKNWSPFSFGEKLCFLYRTSPPVSICLTPQQLASEHAMLTPTLHGHAPTSIDWPWGEVRGGTPAFYLPEIERFGTFFHSSKVTQELGSKRRRRHYYTGFMTFMPDPPFAIDKTLEFPLFTPFWLLDMDSALYHIVFVQGVIERPGQLVVSYGRNDLSAAVMILDRAQLLQHLSAARVGGQRQPPPGGGGQ